MTIKEILVKHVRNGVDYRSSLARKGDYQGDVTFDDHEAADLEKLYNCDNAERMENLEVLKEDVKQKQAAANAEQQAEAEKKAQVEAKEKAEYLKWKERAKRMTDLDEDRQHLEPQSVRAKRRAPSGPEQ